MLCSILSIYIKMDHLLSLYNELLVGKVQRLPGTGQHQPPTGTCGHTLMFCVIVVIYC